MQQNDKQPKFKVILPEGFSLERPKQVITQPVESGRADLEEIIRQETACRQAERLAARRRAQLQVRLPESSGSPNFQHIKECP